MALTGDLRDLKAFVDIEGASGSVYRFRRVEAPTRLPATAGNFLFLTTDGERAHLVCAGTADSLIRAAEIWKSVAEEHEAKTIFVRLNVSRGIRAAEHNDIVDGQKPSVVVTDLD